MSIGPVEVFSWLILIALYLIPAIIAFGRHHHQRWSILVVNALLGWTMIGWIVALAMSVSATNHSQQAQAPAK